jgi:hypothetical protein
MLRPFFHGETAKPTTFAKEDIQDAKNRRSYAFGGDEVWPFFCGYGHAKVRHVPTTACYPRRLGHGVVNLP